MQEVNHARETNGINGSIGAAIEILDDFQDATAAKTLERLRHIRLFAALCLMQCVADASPDFFGKGFQLPPAWPNEQARL